MRLTRVFLLALLLTCCQLAAAHAAQLKILLPLGRTAYQTNEVIDLTILRGDVAALPAGELVLTLTSGEQSKLTFRFPAPAVALLDGKAVSSEHLHLAAALLRPGSYHLAISCDGAAGEQDLEIFSHLRRSSFRLINWGTAGKGAQQVQGENSLGYNLYYGGAQGDELIRAGVDNIRVCTMGGAHQMDMRLECDWSDPYVSRGGAVRAAREALAQRTRGNALGVHFYDEPGLTWWKNPATDQFGPYEVPSQIRAYQSSFGAAPVLSYKLDPSKPADVDSWLHFARWKLGFMDAAWREAAFGVSYVRGDFLSATQSQYGWAAFTDGYYFNVVRSLPVISGHGGYDDLPGGFYCPSYYLEMSRARDLGRPNWYLPAWYGNVTADRFRLEQYLSFITNIQGLMSPPPLEPTSNASAIQGIVETNQLLQRLGPIFTSGMPVQRQPVAVLYALSDVLHAQVLDRSISYSQATAQGKSLLFTYLALKMIQQPMTAIIEEDLLDGSAAAEHKAIVLTAINHLDPAVISALESFIATGGVVLKTADSKVAVAGAIDLGVAAALPDQAKVDKLIEEIKVAPKQDWSLLAPYTNVGKQLQGAAALAKALAAQLNKADIAPTFSSDQSGIISGAQGSGDIRYVFAVNATFDDKSSELLAIKPVTANLRLEAGAASIYDAILARPAAEFSGKSGQRQAKDLAFGPGQMRAWALTARPIGSVKASQPVLRRELTDSANPISLTAGATLLDSTGGVLAGVAPLRLLLIDPLGQVRYELFRATDPTGTLSLTLPLAANDPAGAWTFTAEDLLSGSRDSRSFTYQPGPRCPPVAGASRRALFFADDSANIYRFARTHHKVTIVTGSSAFDSTAAQRIIASLAPWGVTCSIVEAAAVNRARTLTAQEAPTWVGLAPMNGVKAGDQNPIPVVGFAVDGPVILVGNPQDNPLIKFALAQRFLPYAPSPDEFPGRDRGYLAWQLGAVGIGQESLTLIAYDAAGMDQATGTLYELAAGLEPLTRWELPADGAVAPARTAAALPAAPMTTLAIVSDRVVALSVDGKKITALTADGRRAVISASGKLESSKALSADELKKQLAAAAPPADKKAEEALKPALLPLRKFKQSMPIAGGTAVSYWGGTLQILDAQGKPRFQQELPQDITALTAADGKLYAGLADGRICMLEVK